VTNALIIYTNENEINEKIKTIIISLHKTIRSFLKLIIVFIVYLTKLYEIILILILALIFSYDKTYVIVYIDN